MRYDELRKLALMLAKRHNSKAGTNWCAVCKVPTWDDKLKHADGCAIATLEEEPKAELVSTVMVHGPDGSREVLRSPNHIDTNHEDRPYNPETAEEF